MNNKFNEMKLLADFELNMVAGGKYRCSVKTECVPFANHQEGRLNQFHMGDSSYVKTVLNLEQEKNNFFSHNYAAGCRSGVAKLTLMATDMETGQQFSYSQEQKL